MALPDISGLTLHDLMQLINAVNTKISERQQEQTQEKDAALVELRLAYNKLTALIGPDNPTAPGLNTYTEIQKYTDQQIKDNIALAVRQILLGAEMQARIMRDIVRAFVE